MAFQCGFFNSVDGDRKYNAEQMTYPYSLIVSNGVIASVNGSNGLQVLTNNGLNVLVKSGTGIFANKWVKLDTDMSFTVPSASVNYPRIDSIVVRIDNVNRNGQIAYKVGNAETNPSAPTLTRTTNVMEYRLASIAVAKNATSITQGNITDTRATAECGIVTNLLQNSDISATYLQWQTQFDEWFKHLKETVATATLITSFNSNYTTTVDNTTIIPINISRYTKETDILQVYINGLLLIPDVDYSINGYTTITLTKPLNKDNDVTFIVYKSVDGSEAETVITQINELYSRLEKVETEKNALWTGSNLMGAGQVITPSKKLSECAHGWQLVFTDYESGASANSQYNVFVIPKQIINNGLGYAMSYFNIVASVTESGTFGTCYKALSIQDSSITGYAGNTATTAGNDVCLSAIYEY